MRSRKRPASASGRPLAVFGAPVGVELGEDWPSVRTYAERIDRSAKVLSKDAEQQIVYADPAAALARAEEWGTDASIAAAKELAARAKARGPAQTARDLQWADRLRAWRIEWEPWFYDVKGSSPGVPPSTAWQRQQAFETRLRELYASFAALGGKPSETPPATLETPTGKPDDPNAGPPWKLLGYAAGGIALAWGLSSVAKLVRG